MTLPVPDKLSSGYFLDDGVTRGPLLDAALIALASGKSLQSVLGEGPLIAETHKSIFGDPAAATTLAAGAVEDSADAAYVIRVNTTNEFSLGSALFAARSGSAIAVDGFAFYSNAGGDLIAVGDGTDKAVTVWKVRSIAAIRAAIDAAGSFPSTELPGTDIAVNDKIRVHDTDANEEKFVEPADLLEWFERQLVLGSGEIVDVDDAVNLGLWSPEQVATAVRALLIKREIYNAVKAILVHGGSPGARADDTDSEIDILTGASQSAVALEPVRVEAVTITDRGSAVRSESTAALSAASVAVTHGAGAAEMVSVADGYITFAPGTYWLELEGDYVVSSGSGGASFALALVTRGATRPEDTFADRDFLSTVFVPGSQGGDGVDGPQHAAVTGYHSAATAQELLLRFTALRRNWTATNLRLHVVRWPVGQALLAGLAVAAANRGMWLARRPDNEEYHYVRPPMKFVTTPWAAGQTHYPGTVLLHNGGWWVLTGDPATGVTGAAYEPGNETHDDARVWVNFASFDADLFNELVAKTGPIVHENSSEQWDDVDEARDGGWVLHGVHMGNPSVADVSGLTYTNEALARIAEADTADVIVRLPRGAASEAGYRLTWTATAGNDPGAKVWHPGDHPTSYAPEGGFIDAYHVGSDANWDYWDVEFVWANGQTNIQLQHVHKEDAHWRWTGLVDVDDEDLPGDLIDPFRAMEDDFDFMASDWATVTDGTLAGWAWTDENLDTITVTQAAAETFTATALSRSSGQDNGLVLRVPQGSYIGRYRYQWTESGATQHGEATATKIGTLDGWDYYTAIFAALNSQTNLVVQRAGTLTADVSRGDAQIQALLDKIQELQSVTSDLHASPDLSWRTATDGGIQMTARDQIPTGGTWRNPIMRAQFPSGLTAAHVIARIPQGANPRDYQIHEDFDAGSDNNSPGNIWVKLAESTNDETWDYYNAGTVVTLRARTHNATVVTLQKRSHETTFSGVVAPGNLIYDNPALAISADEANGTIARTNFDLRTNQMNADRAFSSFIVIASFEGQNNLQHIRRCVVAGNVPGTAIGAAAHEYQSPEWGVTGLGFKARINTPASADDSSIHIQLNSDGASSAHVRIYGVR